MQRQHKLPRRMIRRKTRLQAQTKLEQRWAPPVRPLRPSQGIVGHPAQQASMRRQGRAHLEGPPLGSRRPFRIKHVGQTQARSREEWSSAAKINHRQVRQPVFPAGRTRRPNGIESPSSQLRRRVAGQRTVAVRWDCTDSMDAPGEYLRPVGRNKPPAPRRVSPDPKTTLRASNRAGVGRLTAAGRSPFRIHGAPFIFPCCRSTSSPPPPCPRRR